MPRIRYLTANQIVDVHDTVLREFGGEDGILWRGTIDLIADTPGRKVYGLEPFRELNDKAAALFHEIIKLHPFVDGNKRTASTSVEIFLEMNGASIDAEKDEKLKIALKTGECKTNVRELAAWFEERLFIAERFEPD